MAEILPIRRKTLSNQSNFKNYKFLRYMIWNICPFIIQETFSTANFIAYVTEALDILHKNIPRAFVNVVETLNIADISALNEGLICDTIHL